MKRMFVKRKTEISGNWLGTKAEGLVLCPETVSERKVEASKSLLRGYMHPDLHVSQRHANS